MAEQTQQFKDVKPSVNYPEMEEKLLQLWRDQNVFQRSMSEREGGPEYVFYEGPPTANGRYACSRATARAPRARARAAAVAAGRPFLTGTSP